VPVPGSTDKLRPHTRKNGANRQHERCEPHDSPETRKRCNSGAAMEVDAETALPEFEDKLGDDDWERDRQVKGEGIERQLEKTSRKSEFVGSIDADAR
jgi:hypothetical protein